jgi:predicted methyltransferase
MLMSRSLHLVSRALAAACVFTLAAAHAAAPQVPAAVQTAVADAGRPQDDRDKDSARKPAESVAFAGIKAGDKVADLLAGQGYFTRIFSKLVGADGAVYATAFPPRPGMPPATALDTLAANPAYANVKVLRALPADLKFPQPLDVVWTSLNYHDIHNQNGQDALNKMAFAALKPGGTYLIIDHAAAAGSGSNDSKTLHRIDPALVKQEVQAAGFKLVAEGDFLHNPDDAHPRVSHDPSIRWHTDQFALKFVKPQ